MTTGSTKGTWVLTQAAFEGLLNRLDPSPDRAGEKYEELRRRLVWFFEMKGSFQPADDADETLNRVARRIHEGQTVENVTAYAHGVARMVLLEALRRQTRERAGEAVFAAFGSPAADENDIRWSCLETCMDSLAANDREVILEYYRDEGAGRVHVRRGLAERLGIPSDMLRVRTFRIRERLEACVLRCLAGSRNAATLVSEGSKPGGAATAPSPESVEEGRADLTGTKETGGARR